MLVRLMLEISVSAECSRACDIGGNKNDAAEHLLGVTDITKNDRGCFVKGLTTIGLRDTDQLPRESTKICTTPLSFDLSIRFDRLACRF